MTPSAGSDVPSNICRGGERRDGSRDLGDPAQVTVADRHPHCPAVSGGGRGVGLGVAGVLGLAGAEGEGPRAGLRALKTWKLNARRIRTSHRVVDVRSLRSRA